ncbi:RNA polymerase subunit sigma-70 [Bradyrhizobium sp. 180]|uniref:RNA polymerase subunit sigma-70 n=1 Tax=unclassified Bradyrhizobium TaxID=2631580 RepID=UPI001FFA4560|nr:MULTISPECIES: RNA polymerase subunit sigma-70 [unclassified Bradyrhizobium]MCK1419471.1 RNA polymerase subunit sigma-70 [Bradyrhizobium sp. CW12]MCK1489872.1 RNA polymerase subunit sigma-70 [Bradyrhizobium sp. 180]MCK1527610.1 RNA polymerase subunit sigma-70 [Bradyrhizobium sp. 182]MCK1595692.1 RNA polymerase subunit sigma-70 [Bradyrhizobium sp. 164]MCK1618385.1 RNA polymerase subunit sigma-70 [Bradyrhizobium sp. 159]
MSVPEIIRRAIEIGERNGKITFDELNQLCDSRSLDPKDVERISQRAERSRNLD